MDFKNINEFVTSKFSEGTTPLTLITSLNTSDTIGNVNAALVLADREKQTVPLSKLIREKINQSVYIQSDSNGIYASVAILCYRRESKTEVLAPKVIQHTSFKVWKTIKIGTVIHGAQLQVAIENRGIQTNYWAKCTMQGSSAVKEPSMPIVPKEQLIDLFLIRIKDLGFKKTVPNYETILQKAREFGLDQCPPEVGPYLRLQYEDQPTNSHVVVASEPIISTDEETTEPMFFHLGNSEYGRKDLISIGVCTIKWKPGEYVVFCSKK